MNSIFRSARLKLTMFYLLILLAMTMTLTLSFRLLAEREYAHSSDVQTNQVRSLFTGYPWDSPLTRPEVAFGNIQNRAESAARDRLNRDFVLVNIAALMIGGVMSYWFAGRTLKPIEEAHELQARFAADASHELRTPLANMQVENDVFLRQKHFTEAEAREQIKSNLEEVQRLEQLSSNLLALTRYDQTDLVLKPTHVRSLVNQAVEHTKLVAELKQVRFEQKVTAQDVLVNHDSMVQLLGIILDNAVKYGPQKSVVTVKGYKRQSQYMIEVIDQGTGIAAADLPHIFERLYRGDRARNTKTGGYGLGLALAKQIAEANQVVITAENQPGAGAKFTVIFELH